MKWEGLAVSFKFLAVKYGSKYGIDLNIGTIAVNLTIDTGSPVTIISYKSLLRSLLPQDIESVFDKLSMTDYSDECGFKSATGNDILSKPAVLRNVRIDGYIINEMGIFVSNVEKPLALLGTDFIDACSISKECNGSIFFHTINEKLAFKNFESQIRCSKISNTGIPDIRSYVNNLNAIGVNAKNTVDSANTVCAFK